MLGWSRFVAIVVGSLAVLQSAGPATAIHIEAFQDPSDPVVEEFQALLRQAREAQSAGDEDRAKDLLRIADERFRETLDEARQALAEGQDPEKAPSMARAIQMVAAMAEFRTEWPLGAEGDTVAGILRRYAALHVLGDREKVEAHLKAKRDVEAALAKIGAPEGLKSVIPESPESEEENGAPLYGRAFQAAFALFRDRPELESALKAPPEERDRILAELIEIENAAPVIELIRQAQAKPVVRFKFDFEVGRAPTVPGQFVGWERTITLFRLLVAAYAERKRVQETVDTVRTLIRLTKDRPGGPGDLELAAFESSCRALLKCIQALLHLDVDDDHADALTREMDTLDPDAVFAFGFTVLACQRLIDVTTNAQSLAEQPIEVEFQTILLQDTLEPIRIWTELKDLCGRPYPDIVDRLPDLVAAQRNLSGTARMLGQFGGTRVESYMDRLVRTRARIALCKAAVRVMAYKSEHGRLPATAEELGGLPEDPFTLEPLKFAEGTIYSVGPNRTDDGGKPGTDDIVLRLR
jgi:hypothetical protein